MVSGDAHRYGFPRSDLTVTLDGVTIKPALALGGWVAFKPLHGHAIVTGDFLLLDSEVAPVMDKLLAGGLEVTAVHNHLLRATPMPIYMHIGGAGDPVKAAATIHDALAVSKTPMDAPGAPAPAPAIDLDTTQLDKTIGAEGKVVGGVYQFAIPRRGKIMGEGVHMDPAGPMGVASAINFQPTGGGRAAVTGDFSLTDNEVAPVIQTLRANGIEVTAVHTHLLTEKPRLVFLHFWGQDDALKLASGLRAALDKVEHPPM